jgi:hypothetical protein
MLEGEKIFHVGVGFVGKKVPESFKKNPNQSYRISGMRKDGLWEVSEADAQFKNRKQPRYWITLPGTVTLIQRSAPGGAKEDVVTQNVAAGGVSVTCTLAAGVGDKVKFGCKEVDFYSIAVVRNRKVPKKGAPTLHLEFIDSEFPIDKVIAKTSALPDR